MTPLPVSVGSPAFVTTRWTQVLTARGESPEARAALGQLCEAYWTPVFRFIRRGGADDEAARDLTQGFFAQLLTRNGLDSVTPEKGRFRSFLLGAAKHYLADQFDRAQAAKRGAGAVPVALNGGTDTDTTTGWQIPDPGTPVPDAYFDRQWAFNLIERVFNVLAADFAAADKSLYFETLKPWLVGDTEALSQVEAGRLLGLSEGAVKVGIHRLRKQFRALVKAEVSQTVGDPRQVQQELRYLVEALAQG